MGHVDALSRCHMSKLVAFCGSDDIDARLQITQNRDPIIVKLRDVLGGQPHDPFELHDGLVYRKCSDDQLLLYVPQEVEENVIRVTHESIAHSGIVKIVDQIRLRYWFPNIKTKVERFVRNCLRCIAYSAPTGDRNLHNIPKLPIPFDTIHIDHYGPLPNIVSKRQHVLTVIDGFTKYVKLYPTISTSTKEVRCSLDKYMEYYGRPRRIVSDRGTCFTSGEFSGYLFDRNIEHVRVATASPQANGQAERVHRVLTAMLGKLTEPIQHSDWVKILAKVEFAINNSIRQVTKKIPSELLFGVRQRGGDVDWLGEYLDEKAFERSERDLIAIWEQAAGAIEVSQRKSSERHANKHRAAQVFKEGEFVMIRNVDTTVGRNKKFVPKFKGPYMVHRVLPHDRYVVRDIENFQVTQVPYDGVIESSHMRRWADCRNLDSVEAVDLEEQHSDDEMDQVDLDLDRILTD